MDKHAGILSLYSYSLVEDLAKKKNISKEKALDYYYNSRFYNLYEREETKLWHFSLITLGDMLEGEISTGRLEIPVEG